MLTVCVCMCMCVYVCVCVCARARAEGMDWHRECGKMMKYKYMLYSLCSIQRE